MVEPTKVSEGEIAPPPVLAVLVLEPDASAGAPLEAALRVAGCDVTWLRDVASASRRVATGAFDVAVLDEELSRAHGLFDAIRKTHEAPSMVVISAFGTVEGAVRAMRDGASHYSAKPAAPEEIVLAVRKAGEDRRLRQENRTLRAALDRRASIGELVVRDPRMREIFSLIETVAQTRATVCLLGESGTGKSVLARTIHTLSPRRAGPFVEVNCGALPDSLLESELFGHAKGSFTGAHRDRAGRFEAASGGTIFLDEIGTASANLQVRLLKVLQERTLERVGEERSRSVDVRVVLATNRDLEAEVRAGRFREDLYYRIHVVAIELPPLRDRKSDIPELARQFLKRSAEALGRTVAEIEPAALERLLAHPWPGNVRELENAVEHAVAVGSQGALRASDLPVEIGRVARAAASERAAAGPERLDDVALAKLEEMLATCERRFIERALESTQGNRTRAAALLGLHRATLYQRMRRVGIAVDGRP